MTKLSHYWKAVVAVIGLAATVATALGLNYPWVPVVVAAATAFGVYQVPNKATPATDPMKGHP